jgi:hypothetical protein
VSELRDNAICPSDHREVITTTLTPRRQSGWTDDGLELRGVHRTSVTQPKDERVFALYNTASAARTTDVATGGIPSPS